MAPQELIELLYRERFGLSSQEMADEPAEAVGYWLSVEAERRELERNS